MFDVNFFKKSEICFAEMRKCEKGGERARRLKMRKFEKGVEKKMKSKEVDEVENERESKSEGWI